MDKLIFLDMDGVMGSEAFYAANHPYLDKLLTNYLESSKDVKVS